MLKYAVVSRLQYNFEQRQLLYVRVTQVTVRWQSIYNMNFFLFPDWLPGQPMSVQGLPRWCLYKGERDFEELILLPTPVQSTSL